MSKNRWALGVFFGIVIVLGACTQQQLNADIQTASVVSCVLADGSEMEYSVATAVVSAQSNPNGARSQTVMRYSGSFVSGSQALCQSLSNLNTKVQAAQSSTAVQRSSSLP